MNPLIIEAYVIKLNAAVAAATTKSAVTRKTYHLHEVQPLGHPQQLANVGKPTVCECISRRLSLKFITERATKIRGPDRLRGGNVSILISWKLITETAQQIYIELCTCGGSISILVSFSY